MHSEIGSVSDRFIAFFPHKFPISLTFFLLGSDPLVRRLYEFEEQIEDPSLNLNPTTRSLWKYRRQVTVEHLGNAFQQADESFDKSQHKILQAFLKQVTAAAVPGSVFCTFFSHAEHSSANQEHFLWTRFSFRILRASSPTSSPLLTIGIKIDPIGIEPLT